MEEKHGIYANDKRYYHEKSISLLTAFVIQLIFMTSPLPAASAKSADYSLFDKFLKYDLCIKDYSALTEEEKQLCYFIFDTEQSADGTVICERARRTLAHDPNIGDRLKLEQLDDCYGIWDSCLENMSAQELTTAI